LWLYRAGILTNQDFEMAFYFVCSSGFFGFFLMVCLIVQRHPLGLQLILFGRHGDRVVPGLVMFQMMISHAQRQRQVILQFFSLFWFYNCVGVLSSGKFCIITVKQISFHWFANTC
jgi:CDP-diacylglycerol--serine O-phosphatidyltransferase